MIFYRWCTSFDCWEQFVPLLFAFKHAHMYIALYTSGRHVNFLQLKEHISHCENLIFFSSSNMSRKLKRRKLERERGAKNGWAAFLIEVTVDVSVLQLEIHHRFCAFFCLLFLLVNWRKVTVRHTITRKLQRPYSHETQRHKINEMECMCMSFLSLSLLFHLSIAQHHYHHHPYFI